MPTKIERREGFTTVTPYVTVENIEGLISFAQGVFGAVETECTTGSAGGFHCELRIGDSMLMCGGGPAARSREKRTALHIQVSNLDGVYARALESGAESLFPPEDKPYGERNSGVRDPVGNTWYIASHRGPLEEGIRTVTPYLLRRNALGLIEFLKQVFSYGDRVGSVEDAWGDTWYIARPA